MATEQPSFQDVSHPLQQMPFLHQAPPVYGAVMPQISQPPPLPLFSNQAVLLDMMSRMALSAPNQPAPQPVQDRPSVADEQKNRLLEFIIRNGAQMDANSIESFNHLLLLSENNRLAGQPVPFYPPRPLEIQQPQTPQTPAPSKQRVEQTVPKPSQTKNSANLNTSLKQDNDKFLLDMLLADQVSKVAPSSVKKNSSVKPIEPVHRPVKQQQQQRSDFFRKNTAILHNDSYQDQEDSQLIEEIFFLK